MILRYSNAIIQQDMSLMLFLYVDVPFPLYPNFLFSNGEGIFTNERQHIITVIVSSYNTIDHSVNVIIYNMEGETT